MCNGAVVLIDSTAKDDATRTKRRQLRPTDKIDASSIKNANFLLSLYYIDFDPSVLLLTVVNFWRFSRASPGGVRSSNVDNDNDPCRLNRTAESLAYSILRTRSNQRCDVCRQINNKSL